MKLIYESPDRGQTIRAREFGTDRIVWIRSAEECHSEQLELWPEQ